MFFSLVKVTAAHLPRANIQKYNISPLSLSIMADRRPEDQEMTAAKRVKTERNMDPTVNPYLAHHYNGKQLASANSSPLANFQRHNTTAKQADIAENGTVNPFTGTKLSDTYFSILKTRKNLPVHKQRFALIPYGSVTNQANIWGLGKSSWIFSTARKS